MPSLSYDLNFPVRVCTIPLRRPIVVGAREDGPAERQEFLRKIYKSFAIIVDSLGGLRHGEINHEPINFRRAKRVIIQFLADVWLQCVVQMCAREVNAKFNTARAHGRKNFWIFKISLKGTRCREPL